MPPPTNLGLVHRYYSAEEAAGIVPDDDRHDPGCVYRYGAVSASGEQNCSCPRKHWTKGYSHRADTIERWHGWKLITVWALGTAVGWTVLAAVVWVLFVLVGAL